MTTEILNRILTIVLIADVIERRFQMGFQTFLVNISYNCIYLFSKLQIFITNSNEKLNNFIETTPTLLQIKNNIKQFLKPSIPIMHEFIKDGKSINIFNGIENAYDFRIVSWMDEKNNYINKKLVYYKDSDTSYLSLESDIKFMLIEIKIGENNMPYKIDLKTDNFNYYLVENKFDKQFFIYYLKKYLEITEINYDEKISLKIIDHDVNTFEMDFTDKNESIVLKKNGYQASINDNEDVEEDENEEDENDEDNNDHDNVDDNVDNDKDDHDNVDNQDDVDNDNDNEDDEYDIFIFS